jgi:hypothetical protein
MIVSDWPIAWDFDRWRRTLETYSIDGQPVFHTAIERDRAKLDELSSWKGSLEPTTDVDKPRPIEPCGEILERTAGRKLVTDDNMGNEWRYVWGLE